MNNPLALVYFARNESTGLVKVGVTFDLKQRMEALKRQEGAPLTVLGASLGSLKDQRVFERNTHKLLAPTQVRREWFRPSALLDECIRACTEQTRQMVAPLDARGSVWRLRVGAPESLLPLTPDHAAGRGGAG